MTSQRRVSSGPLFLAPCDNTVRSDTFIVPFRVWPSHKDNFFAVMKAVAFFKEYVDLILYYSIFEVLQ